MAYHYRAEGREPGTLPKLECVTGNLNITYRKPTPLGVELTLRARVEGDVGRKTRVLCEVWAGDVLTVTADSIFVRVNPEDLKVSAHSRA
jgi:acyl-CoA thioesterase FadM